MSTVHNCLGGTINIIVESDTHTQILRLARFTTIGESDARTRDNLHAHATELYSRHPTRPLCARFRAGGDGSPCAARGIDGCGSKAALKNNARLHNRALNTQIGCTAYLRNTTSVSWAPPARHIFLRYEIQQEKKGEQIQLYHLLCRESIHRTHVHTQKRIEKIHQNITVRLVKYKNKRERQKSPLFVVTCFFLLIAHF